MTSALTVSFRFFFLLLLKAVVKGVDDNEHTKVLSYVDEEFTFFTQIIYGSFFMVDSDIFLIQH